MRLASTATFRFVGFPEASRLNRLTNFLKFCAQKLRPVHACHSVMNGGRIPTGSCVQKTVLKYIYIYTNPDFVGKTCIMKNKLFMC
jgi:hypothetical protein